MVMSGKIHQKNEINGWENVIINEIDLNTSDRN